MQSDKFHIPKNQIPQEKIDSTISTTCVFLLLAPKKLREKCVPCILWGARKSQDVCGFTSTETPPRCKILRPRKHLKKNGGGITVWDWALAGLRGFFKWPIWDRIKLDGHIWVILRDSPLIQVHEVWVGNSSWPLGIVAGSQEVLRG